VVYASRCSEPVLFVFFVKVCECVWINMPESKRASACPCECVCLTVCVCVINKDACVCVCVCRKEDSATQACRGTKPVPPFRPETGGEREREQGFAFV